MSAIYIIHSEGSVGLLINVLVYIVIAILLLCMAREFGVSDRYLRLLGMALLVVMVLVLLVGCGYPVTLSQYYKDQTGAEYGASESFTLPAKKAGYSK